MLHAVRCLYRVPNGDRHLVRYFKSEEAAVEWLLFMNYTKVTIGKGVIAPDADGALVWSGNNGFAEHIR